jgi:hypothetical protein
MGGPGAGKSHLIFTVLKTRFSDNEILAVVPFNGLVHKIHQKWGTKAITIHEFLGIDIDLDSSKAPFDMKKNGIKAVFFDEAMLWRYDISVLIYDVMCEHLEEQMSERIHFMAAGDAQQMEPIAETRSTLKERLENIVHDSMFTKVIILTENHRVNNDFDKRWMAIIKQELFHDEGMQFSALDFVRYFFPESQQVANLDEVKAKGLTTGFAHYKDCAKYLNRFTDQEMIRHDPLLERVVMDDQTFYLEDVLICKHAMRVYMLLSQSGRKACHIELEDQSPPVSAALESPMCGTT